MLDLTTIVDIAGQVSYKPGWGLALNVDRDRRPYLQVVVDTTTDASLDSHKRDGTRTPWRGAKHYLSYHMSRQEIVGTAFAAFQAAEMHELREWFRYRNASIFNPHLDPDVLAAVASKASSFDTRENAMTMTEPTTASDGEAQALPDAAANTLSPGHGSAPSPASNWR